MREHKASMAVSRGPKIGRSFGSLVCGGSFLLRSGRGSCFYTGLFPLLSPGLVSVTTQTGSCYSPHTEYGGLGLEVVSSLSPNSGPLYRETQCAFPSDNPQICIQRILPKLCLNDEEP